VVSESLGEPPGMTNFDHSIDEELEEYLIKGGDRARHNGWNFCGFLSYEDGLFAEEVYVEHICQEIITASTLPDLMKKVNDEYGWD
jgi:hypothetical protein